MKKNTWILLLSAGMVAAIMLLLPRHYSNDKHRATLVDEVAAGAVIQSYTARVTQPEPCVIAVCGDEPDRKVPEYLLPATQ